MVNIRYVSAFPNEMRHTRLMLNHMKCFGIS